MIPANMIHKFLLPALFLCFIAISSSFAQDGYEIKVKIDGFENDTLLLGYQYADKQYIKDTVLIEGDTYTFKGDEKLECGMYLLVMPPANQYVQFLVNDVDQHFTVQTTAENPVQAAKIDGSIENDIFYDYIQFISSKTPIAQELHKKVKEEKDQGKDFKESQSKIDALDKEVADYQQAVIGKHPTSMTSRIISTGKDIDVPDFGTTDEARKQRFYYIRKHWFDNINLSDPCMIRTSLIHNKVMTYLEKLVVHHPDSIAVAVDEIVSLASNNEETKRHWLSTLLNKYANSKVVGMDALYVHIVMNYYAKGDTPWVEPEKLIEIVDNASKTEPLLIGKIAPEIALPRLDVEATLVAMDKETEEAKKFVLGEKQSLHNLDSPYKVLFIWAPDCGHCKKSMPKMIEFYDEFKDKGVELFAICHQNYKSTPECAEFIKDRPEMLRWVNVTDPYFRSRYQSIYNVKSTPQIYVLDEKNEILFKRVGAEQLADVMNDIFKRTENK